MEVNSLWGEQFEFLELVSMMIDVVPCMMKCLTFLYLCECSYRPSVEIDFVEKLLGFTEKQQCLDFLATFPSVVITADGSKVDCKSSSVTEQSSDKQ